MTLFIINPGTEARSGTTLQNARAVATQLCMDCSMPRSAIKQNPSDDLDGGFYGFVLRHKKKRIELQIPGDAPEITLKSVPFESRRLYVDGSSWLYGYAVDVIKDRLEL